MSNWNKWHCVCSSCLFVPMCPCNHFFIVVFCAFPSLKFCYLDFFFSLLFFAGFEWFGCRPFNTLTLKTSIAHTLTHTRTHVHFGNCRFLHVRIRRNEQKGRHLKWQIECLSSKYLIENIHVHRPKIELCRCTVFPHTRAGFRFGEKEIGRCDESETKRAPHFKLQAIKTWA